MVTPTPVPAVPNPGLIQGTIEALICSYSWPCEEALAVAYCESGSDLYAAPEENPGHRGIFQLGEVHAWRFERRGWDWGVDGLVLERNIAIAYELWLEQGWSPWGFSGSCHGIY